MFEKNSLDLFLFTDEPVRDLEHDHLALKPFSSMIAAAALTNRGPFNIGVFSGWGQGKTTVLRQAEALIRDQEKPNVITAWVNAWQYEHEAHPIVPLLAIIINEITSAIDARKSVSEKENAALAKTFGDLKRALRAIAYGFSAKAGAKIPGFANLEIGFVAKDMIDRDEKLSSDRDPLLDQSLYYHAYERLDRFRGQLAKSKPADQPKIIVFIDDLDRCLPEKALHLLESLKLVLAQPGFIFVLGVDRHVIDSFLIKRYHEDFGIHTDMGHGRQYMDKIIQLPLDLPHHQNRFEKYIGKLVQDTASLPPAFSALFTDPEAGPAFISALAAGCDRTPRTLIRTLNYLLTDLFLRENEFFLADKDPFGENHGEFLKFAAVSRITRITFGSEYARLYRRLVNDERACQQIADHFGERRHVTPVAEEPQVETGPLPPPAVLQVPDHVRQRSIQKKRQESARPPLGTAIVENPPLPDNYVHLIGDSESLDELFRTPLGQKWLKENEKRQAIEGFLATREDPGQIPDETSEQIINAAIRAKLDLPEGSVGDSDRKKITDLVLRGTPVSDLTPLQSLTNLQTLDLNGTQVSDLTPLKSLTNLQALNLNNTQVISLTPIENLTSLQSLHLMGTPVSDLTPLDSLTSLQRLDLMGTPVSDLTPLKSLTSLQSLFLGASQVISLSPLKGLTNLKSLNLSNTQVSDLTPLKYLSSLQDLSLRMTRVSDLTPLQSLTGLQSLDVRHTQVSDLTLLREMKYSLKRLVLGDTPAVKNKTTMAALREALPNTTIIS